MSLSKKQKEWLEQNGSDGENFANVPEELSTEGFWLEAVRKNDRALQYVPKAWKTEALDAIIWTISSGFSFGSGGSGYGIGLIKKDMPEEWATEEFWIKAVQKHYRAFNYVPEAMRTEAVRHAAEALCLAAVQQNSYALNYVPEALKTEAVCLAAVQNGGYPYPLQYVPEALKTEAVCLAAVQKYSDSLKYVPEAMRTEAVYIEVMKQSKVSYHYTQYSTAKVYDGHPLEGVPGELQTEAVCLTALLSDSDAWRYVPEALKTETFRAIVSSASSASPAISSGSGGEGYGLHLIWPKDLIVSPASPAISSGSGGEGYGIHLIKPKDLIVSVEAAYKSVLMTEALCLAEVQKNGRALRYVPEEFKTEAVCLAAVQQSGLALAYVPEALKTEALCLEAMKHMAISSDSGYLGGYGVGLIKTGEKG